jgi:hypothetical protein
MTQQRYTMGIFRITIRNTISQTESGATVGVYRWNFLPNDRRKERARR